MLPRILGNERGTETERGRRIISTCRLVSPLAFAKPPPETAAAAFARPGDGRDRRSPPPSITALSVILLQFTPINNGLARFCDV